MKYLTKLLSASLLALLLMSCSDSNTDHSSDNINDISAQKNSDQSAHKSAETDAQQNPKVESQAGKTQEDQSDKQADSTESESAERAKKRAEADREAKLETRALKPAASSLEKAGGFSSEADAAVAPQEVLEEQSLDGSSSKEMLLEDSGDDMERMD